VRRLPEIESQQIGGKMNKSAVPAIVVSVLVVVCVGLLLRHDLRPQPTEHKRAVLTSSGLPQTHPRLRPTVRLPDRHYSREEEVDRDEAPEARLAERTDRPDLSASSREALLPGSEDPGARAASDPEAEPTGAAALRLAVAPPGSAGSAEGTPPLIEEAVETDPDTGALRFPPGARLAYPDSGGIDPNEGAVAFWIRKEWGSEQQLARSLLDLRTNTWENRLGIGLGPAYLRFLIATADGVETAAGTGVQWQPEEWHHVTITWGQALMGLYVDGKLAEQQTYAGELRIPSDAPLYIASGRNPPDLPEGTVSLRQFIVLDHRPDNAEIGSLLAETAPGQ